MTRLVYLAALFVAIGTLRGLAPAPAPDPSPHAAGRAPFAPECVDLQFAPGASTAYQQATYLHECCEPGYTEVDLVTRECVEPEPDDDAPYDSPSSTGFGLASPPPPYTSPVAPATIGSTWPGPVRGGYAVTGGSGGGTAGGGVGPAPVPLSVAKGDPHFVTRDRVAFTSLTLGEFVYAQPRVAGVGALELHARHGRLAGFAPWATFVIAAAVRAGGHTFEVGLPAAASAPLRVRLDGAEVALPPGSYRIGEVAVNLGGDGELELAVEEPSLPAALAGTPEAWSRVRIARRVDHELVQPVPGQAILALEVSFSTPPLGRYAGLLGVPDGDAANELTQPDGVVATRIAPFVESWRITDATRSAFTYGSGEGPATYNLVQDQLPPTPAQLRGQGGGRDYVGEIIALITSRCGQAASTLDPVLVLQLAYDLAAGRPAQDFLAAGLCYDERLGPSSRAFADAPVAAAAVHVRGRITRQGAAGEGVGGVTVVVRAPQLGAPLCATTSAADGGYACGAIIDPRIAASLELRWEASGRGPLVTATQLVATPADRTTTVVTRDLEVAPAVGVRVTGTVRDPDGRPVPGAPVRLTSPAYLETVADAAGVYQLRLWLPDGTTAGRVRVEAASVDFTASASAEPGFTVTSGVTELTQDLRLVAATPPATVDLHELATGRRLVLTGRVRNALVTGGADGVGGATVTVEAAGAIDGDRCVATTGPDGRYTCEARLTGADGFTATVTVSRLGTARAEVVVPAAAIPAAGGWATRTVDDLIVTPTTLAVTGRVLAAGQGRPNAQVAVRLDALALRSPTVITDASGAYQARLVVPDDVAATATLTVQATDATATGVDLAEVTAAVGTVVASALNPRTQDVVFTRRGFRFAGTVRNGLVPGAVVRGAVVEVRRPDAVSALCSAQTDEQGRYGCDGYVDGDAPFAVIHRVSEVGALTTDELRVTPTGSPIGPPQLVARDLTVLPTTVRVSGTVRRTDGTPVPAATVVIAELTQGGWPADLATVTTDATGGYAHALALPDTRTQLELAVRADDRVTAARAQRSVLTPTATRTELAIDFTLDAPGALVERSRRAIAGAELVPGRSGVAVDAAGVVYALASYPGGIAKLAAIDPDGTVRTSTANLAGALAGDDSGRDRRPVIGRDASGGTLIYVTSTRWLGSGLGYRGYVQAFRPDLSLAGSWEGVAGYRRISPAVAVGTDGTVFLVTRADGADAPMLLWALPAGLTVGAPGRSVTLRTLRDVIAPPAIGRDGTVYIHGGDAIDAYAPDTLAPRWASPATCESSIDYGLELAIGRDGGGADLIYAAGYDGSDAPMGRLCAVGADGTLRWSWPRAGNGVGQLDNASAPVIGLDGRAYLLSQGSPHTRLVGLDPTTGDVSWSRLLPRAFDGGAPAVGADGTIYVEARVYGSSASGSTQVYGFDPTTGAVRHLELGETDLRGDLVLAPGGRLLAGYQQYVGGSPVHGLITIEASSGPATTAWTMAGGGPTRAGRSGD